MLKKLSNKKGFSLIELIVTIAIIGILVMLATPKFLNYVEKAELVTIQHDVKIMEDKMAEFMIHTNEQYQNWEDNSKDLNLLVMAKVLFETEGRAKRVNKPNLKQYGDLASDKMLFGETEIGASYKIIPNSMKKDIKSSLGGTFYTNIDGKVYYEHGKPLLNVREEIFLRCEAPKPTEYDFDHISGTIVKYRGTSQHVVIPSAFEVDGVCWPVRVIGKGAFMRGGEKEVIIETVVIPNSVTEIEEDAFKDNELEQVIIPPGVTNIGDNAFNGNSIRLSGGSGSSGSGSGGGSGAIIQGGSSSSGGGGAPGGSGVGGNPDIGYGTFANNGSNGTTTVTPEYRPSTDKDLGVKVEVTTNEEGKKEAIIKDYNGNDTSIIIPPIIEVDSEEVSVTEIGEGAYQGKGIITVQFPEGLQRIDDYAFAGNQIIGVFTPTSIRHIGNYAFSFNEVTHGSKYKPTIRSIEVQEEEHINDLDKKGNITDGGTKIDVIKDITKMLDYIFVNSKSGLVIDVGPGVENIASWETSLMAVGGNYSLSIIDNTVYAWGHNNYGQLGDGTISNKYSPVQVKGLTGIRSIATGYYHSLALREDGTVWAWGNNAYGELGNGTNIRERIPVQVKGLTNIRSIAAGNSHSLALTKDGTIYAWGRNNSGQVGNGTNTNENIPVLVSGINNITNMEAGAEHSIALTNDGKVYAWGHNGSGQLGDGTSRNKNTPQQVKGVTGVVSAVGAGSSHSVVLITDGTVYTWGNGRNLGDGKGSDSRTPVQVKGLTGISMIAVGNQYTAALKNNGTVWTWGNNLHGQLGDGTITDRKTPIQVSGLSNIKDIYAGWAHSLALRSDGTIRAWGINNYGQLGDGSVSSKKAPVEVKGLRISE